MITLSSSSLSAHKESTSNMAASIPCITLPPFSIKSPSSSSSSPSPSLCSLGSHSFIGSLGVKLRPAGPRDGYRAWCWLKPGKNGVEFETDDTEQAVGRNLLGQSFINFRPEKHTSAVLLGVLLATAELPAMAVTGVNDEEDLIWVLIQIGIIAFFYFLVAPPIIMNWLRIRWYRRNVFEMYLQFMFVFMFFPGVLIWAPFLNFRKFPRDPSMKYPWSVPEDPAKVKNSYLKFPFAQPEDYDL